MERSAFVTGATGFVGANLIRKLLDNNWAVTALYRPTSDLSSLKGLPVTLKQGNITDMESLARIVSSNTEVIFHLAGSTDLWSGNNEWQNTINIEGTENVVRVAVLKDVDRIIHTSSVAAWGNQRGTITEETPQLGKDSWVNYEYSKWAGEQKALSGIERGVEVVIMNPASILGPYDKSNWGRLFFALRDGDLPAVIEGGISITHVNSVVDAHLSAVDKGKSGNRYILGGDPCTIYDFVKEVARVSGVSRLPRKVPVPILKLYARWEELTSFFTQEEPDVTPELVKILSRNNVHYSSKKAEEELGYEIRPMEEAVYDCYKWLKEENLL